MLCTGNKLIIVIVIVIIVIIIGLPVASSVSVILLWSCIQYELLTVINVNSIINQVIWDPMTAYEFVTVGVAGIEFWMLEKRNNMAELKVYQPTDHDLQLPVRVRITDCIIMCY